MQSLSAFLEDISTLKVQVERSLESYLDFNGDCPDVLNDAMKFSLQAGGKRLRPVLVLLACEACDGNLSDAMPAACAIEMIHTYSLIHDDLPAMDDDALRRGKPTNHVVFGEANAILAGDALLTKAFEVIATQVQPPEVAAKCCAILANASGAEGMVGGQVADLDSEKNSVESSQQLEAIHRRKTGRLISSSLELGATIAQASPEKREFLSEYGLAIGLAFQIADDLLDCTGDEKKLGKGVRKDAQRGKATYPGFWGVEASREKAEELISRACQMLESFGEQGERLEALARYVIEREN